MARIVQNAKDGVDQMIETSSAVQSILDNRPETPNTLLAKEELKRINKELSRVREMLARDGIVRTTVRDRPSTRMA